MNPSADTNPTPRVLHAIPFLEEFDPLPPEVLPVSPEPPLDVLPAPEPVPAFARRSFLGWVVYTVGSVLEWLFGLASLFLCLAILAAVPILQFLSLGYLLEAGGRVARTGKLRHGLIGVRRMARLGSIVLGTWVLLLPVRIVADLAESAEIIDPGSRIAERWRLGLTVLIGLMFIHLVSAIARGGRLRYFLWPFNVIWLIRRLWRGGYYPEARDAVWECVVALRLPYYFWLGFRGFIGAFAWLVLPITLMALSRGHPNGTTLAGFLGGFLLAFVLLYLPFLQLRLAATNRFRAVFDLRAVRAAFKRAPWAFAFSFVLTLLFAVPLYILKIQVVPREAEWLPSLVFIGFIFPARLLTGWALGRASRRTEPRHWFFRWTARIPLLPVAGMYVLIVFFTQYTSWNGVWSLYEQHAFLVPVPFFGM